jgi:hypothetical protein
MARPDGRYRLTEVEKTTVIAEMRAALIEAARVRQLLTYTDLALKLESVYVHPHSFVFAHLLRTVCAAEWARTGVMLCALVVSKQTGIPGGGYFRSMALAESDDPLEAWRADVQRVFDYWSEH